jgi:hypothetical protein
MLGTGIVAELVKTRYMDPVGRTTPEDEFRKPELDSQETIPVAMEAGQFEKLKEMLSETRGEREIYELPQVTKVFHEISAREEVAAELLRAEPDDHSCGFELRPDLYRDN